MAANRSARVVSNDAAVLDAAVAVLNREGWAGLTVAGVARECDLSNRAVHSRFPGRAELGLAAWEARALPALTAATTRLVTALDEHDAEAVVGSLVAFADPEPDLRIAAELLIVSPFDARILQARAPYEDLVRSLAPADDNAEQRARSAVAAYALALGLGLLCATHKPLAPLDELTAELRRQVEALVAPASPQDLPDTRAPHLGHVIIDTGDPIRDALLTAALEVMGERGFDCTTTARVTRAAGVSEGAMFNRYPTKLALFADAVAVYQNYSYRANEAFARTIGEERSRGIGEAVTIREMMRPGVAGLRRLSLEHVRVCWHDPGLAETTVAEIKDFVGTLDDTPMSGRSMAYWHVGWAVGNGVLLVAQLHPDAWTLPYDVVTVPVEDRIAPQPSTPLL